MKLFLKSFFLVFCLLGPDLWASADTVLQEEITSGFEGDILDQNHLFIVREAFLEETFKKLRLKDITSQMKKEDQAEETPSLYSFEASQFDEVFPLKYEGEETESNFYIGQIIGTQRRNGIGTGCLISIEKCGTGLVSKGITALHNFVSFTNGALSFNPSDSFTFLHGYRSIEKDTSNFHSCTAIRKIYFLKDNMKDICLFEGKLTPHEKVYDNDNSFLEIKNIFPLPEFYPEEISLEEEREGLMYHYPLGKTERVNGGILFKQKQGRKSLHKIDTLFGSSGAPIFVNKKIVGLHVGSSVNSILEDKRAITPPGLTKNRIALYVARNNCFEKITSGDIQNLLEGVELFEAIYNSSNEDQNAIEYLNTLKSFIQRSYLIDEIGENNV